MRSHVTLQTKYQEGKSLTFQYRKRYEVTCDSAEGRVRFVARFVSIPQAV